MSSQAHSLSTLYPYLSWSVMATIVLSVKEEKVMLTVKPEMSSRKNTTKAATDKK